MGSLCNYLVQHFRRNHVCQLAILMMLVCIAVIYLTICGRLPMLSGGLAVFLSRFCLGASFGLAQMVLVSTLIIDVCESFQRTEANHSAAWFGRFAMSLGPAAALLIYRFFGLELVLLSSGVCCLFSMLLIQLVSFPFKAPEDRVRTLSLDRFFLPSGWLLFVNLLLITTIIGLVMSTPLSNMFYGMMMCGFFFALLAERFVFVNADLKSETITGLILIIAALLMMKQSAAVVNTYIPPVLIGFAVGIIGSRFLLFFIKLSRHCQRGTSQSTFFLAWETGISMGLFLGYSYLSDHVAVAGIILAVVALVAYHFITHPWYMKHKNR
jgi:MFS family permease